MGYEAQFRFPEERLCILQSLSGPFTYNPAQRLMLHDIDDSTIHNLEVLIASRVGPGSGMHSPAVTFARGLEIGKE